MSNTDNNWIERFFRFTDRIEAAKNKFFDNEKQVRKAAIIHGACVIVFVILSFIYYAPK